MKRQSQTHPMSRWILWIVGIVVVASLGGLIYGANYFYDLALNPTISKEAIFGSASGRNTDPEKEAARKWLEEESGYEDVYRVSHDGLTLHAYEIKSPVPSATWIIEVHGYMGEGKDMARCSKVYQEDGYHLLIPDLRGHGLSEGDYVGMGWDDRFDMLSWIDYLIEKDPEIQIVLYGVSMGGATVMMTAGEALPPQVKAIIEDCGYSTAWEEFSYNLETLFELPTYPLMPVANLVTKVRAGYFLSEASSIKQVAKSKTPILFIHGKEDTFVPFFMLDEVYNAATCEKEKLVIPGAAHAACAEMEPELYKQTVKSFLDKHLD